MLAHAPLQLLVAPLSFSKRYSVRPLASTRIRPSLVSRVLTVALAVLGAGLAVPYNDPPPTVPDEPPQPATTTATSATVARGRMTARSRLIFMVVSLNEIQSTRTCSTTRVGRRHWRRFLPCC